MEIKLKPLSALLLDEGTLRTLTGIRTHASALVSLAVGDGLHAIDEGLPLVTVDRCSLDLWLLDPAVPDDWRDAVRTMLFVIDERKMVNGKLMIDSTVRIYTLPTRAICTRGGEGADSRDVELEIGANRTASGDRVVLRVVGTNGSWYVLSLLGASVCVDGRYPYFRMPDRRICLDAGVDSWCENFDVVMAEALVTLVSMAAGPARFS